MIEMPAYRININGTAIQSDSGHAALRIDVYRGMCLPLDFFSVTINTVKKPGKIKVGNPVSIKLGYEDDLKKVFTGTVGSIASTLKGIEIRGFNMAAPLAMSRLNRVYERQNCGDIVKSLAGTAGISVREASEGLSFPMYTIDDAKTLYEHMNELSVLCGFDLYMTGEGKLVFKKYEPGQTTRLQYGKDIIDSESAERMQRVTCVKAFAESPSSFKGPDKWHWMSKKVVEASSGKGDPIVLMKNPAVRDKATADKISAAAMDRSHGVRSGTLKTLGNATVDPGGTIEIVDMPDDSLNGAYAVTGVIHRMAVSKGFISFIDWVGK